jgi:hypothetical protein
MNERTDEEVENDAAEAESQADAIKDEKQLLLLRHFEGIEHLPIEVLRVIVACTRELLWPLDDPGREWSPDTIAAIANIFEECGLDRTVAREPDDEP